MIFDPQTGQYIQIDEFKTRQRFNDFMKVIDSVNVGIENLHDSLMKFTESLGITHDHMRLPWDPLITETDYPVRPIIIQKGGWGR